MALTGTHFVRILRSALQKGRKTWPKTRDRMEVRRQIVKLRFWGERSECDSFASVLDLSYESIKSMPGKGVYELRLDDAIGGQRNIRAIFLVPPEDWVATQTLPLPVIWILEVMPKRRDEWTKFDLLRFKAGRAIVKERFYE